MQVQITHDVECCHDCPRIYNSAWEHDDPFTSAPIGVWECLEKDGPGYKVGIGDFNMFKNIHPNCPLNKGSKNELTRKT